MVVLHQSSLFVFLTVNRNKLSWIDAPVLLFPENLLNVADLFLHLAGYLLGTAFDFQIWIPADFPCHLFDLAFYLINFPST